MSVEKRKVEQNGRVKFITLLQSGASKVLQLISGNKKLNNMIAGYLEEFEEGSDIPESYITGDIKQGLSRKEAIQLLQFCKKRNYSLDQKKLTDVIIDGSGWNNPNDPSIRENIGLGLLNDFLSKIPYSSPNTIPSSIQAMRDLSGVLNDMRWNELKRVPLFCEVTKQLIQVGYASGTMTEKQKSQLQNTILDLRKIVHSGRGLGKTENFQDLGVGMKVFQTTLSSLLK